MNKLLYVLFISIFLLNYLSLDLGLLSRHITYLPEVLTLLTTSIILARITVGYGENFPAISTFFLILFASNIIIGIIVNHISSGTLIAGIRTYLKFIPFFILPFVYHFSNTQINKQIKLLFFLFLIQLPVSIYQRFVLSGGLITGDYVKGTIGGSGQLTVILVCAITILLTFYLAKKISFTSFIVAFSILFLPMTMNETKSTLILLPTALILPLLFSSTKISLKQLVPLIAFITLAGFSFLFIYDYFVSSKSGAGMMDFLSGDGRAEFYLYRGTEIGSLQNVGRIDTYVIAFKILSDNILHLLFGLGIGNVSESFIPSFSGSYAADYSIYNVDMTSLTLILWELGISGIIIYYFLFLITYRYSKKLSIRDDFIGTFSNGWRSLSIIIMIGTLYTSVFNLDAMGYLYWYFSGFIISENFRKNRT